MTDLHRELYRIWMRYGPTVRRALLRDGSADMYGLFSDGTVLTCADFTTMPGPDVWPADERVSE